MKTIFVFREMNFKKVAHTNKPYNPGDTYILKTDGNEVETVVDKIVFKSNGTRMIYLKKFSINMILERDELSLDSLRELEKSAGIEWVDSLLENINGSTGEVFWGSKKRKRRR